MSTPNHCHAEHTVLMLHISAFVEVADKTCFWPPFLQLSAVKANSSYRVVFQALSSRAHRAQDPRLLLSPSTSPSTPLPSFVVPVGCFLPFHALIFGLLPLPLLLITVLVHGLITSPNYGHSPVSGFGHSHPYPLRLQPDPLVLQPTGPCSLACRRDSQGLG